VGALLIKTAAAATLTTPNPMTTKKSSGRGEDELKELNKFIAEHVMGYLNEEDYLERFWQWEDSTEQVQHLVYEPTNDSSAAMEVLKRCSENQAPPFLIGVKYDGWYCVQSFGDSLSSAVKAASFPTLELAICNAAKQLFSKQS
jgi:hypothetical protein